MSRSAAPEPLDLPTGDWAAWIGVRADADLAHADATLAELRDRPERPTSDVLELWNSADASLRGLDGLAGLVAQVHPDPAVRTAAETVAQRVDRARTERGLDAALFAALDATDPEGLDDVARRMRDQVLRDFRRSGVDRPKDVRNRLRDINERLTLLGQAFDRTIRDDVRSIRIQPEQLAGLPDDYRAEHRADAEGLVTLTTDYPDVLPFRAFAHDRDARRELMTVFLNRGYPANEPALHEILALRHEKATLLGYADWADYDAEIKMIGSGAAIADFVDRLDAAARPASDRDRAVLLNRQREDRPDATTLDVSDRWYYTRRIAQEQFDLDPQEVRRYFEFGKVRAGLLEITGRLFGLTYTAVDAPTWHPDVAVYDVHSGGERIGRIFLDLHPREGKYKHAAQFDVAAGEIGVRLPEGALVCNFSTGLMEHDDVVTLFHEFGHLVHHIVAGRQHWARFSGVATEWDFVEAPSQMLEEWAWDAEVLRTFATDADGTPIPVELVQRMRSAHAFGQGMSVRTQLFYAALALAFHRERPADFTAVLRDLQARYDAVDYLPDTHFYASFGHLEGYSSAYYTYMWSLVIAKDLLSAFDPGDLLNADVASRYRDRILAPGGSRDAARLVEDFLGRPFTFDAFVAWLDRPVAKSCIRG